VHARDGRALRTQFRVRIPAGIEEHQHGPDAVFLRDDEELFETLLETLRILLPEFVVQEHAHGVHADCLRPAELLVDLRRVEGVGLPHLELVDGVGRNVVAAHEPALVCVPAVGLLHRPLLRIGERRRT